MRHCENVARLALQRPLSRSEERAKQVATCDASADHAVLGFAGDRELHRRSWKYLRAQLNQGSQRSAVPDHSTARP